MTPRRPQPAPRVLLGSLVVAATLALGACSDDDDDDMNPATDGDVSEGTGDGAGETSMPAPGVTPGGEIDMSPRDVRDPADHRSGDPRTHGRRRRER